MRNNNRSFVNKDMFIKKLCSMLIDTISGIKPYIRFKNVLKDLMGNP